MEIFKFSKTPLPPKKGTKKREVALLQRKLKELKLASQAEAAVDPNTRQLCAARLIAFIDTAGKAAATHTSSLGGKGGQKKGGKDKKRKAAEMEAAAAAATAAAPEVVQAARLENAFLAEVVAFVSKVSRAERISCMALIWSCIL